MNKKIDELRKELEEERKFIRELYGILLSSTDRDAFTQSSYAVLNRLRLWVNRDFDRIVDGNAGKESQLEKEVSDDFQANS